jgi:hypothetical protein
MYCYCLSYTDHTYNSLNKQPEGTVIVLVIPTILTIVLINNQCTVIVLVIPTTHEIVLINKQKVLLLSQLYQPHLQ